MPIHDPAARPAPAPQPANAIPRCVLAFDVGSNSVGSAWVDLKSGTITTGVSIFPAGVDEADEKRGEPKNAKRRMTRRTRITLRRRAQRKRALRLRLIAAGLLPATAAEFKALLEGPRDPWELRRDGLTKPLTPFEFGRVLLHMAQRRGALGLKAAPAQPDADTKAKAGDAGAAGEEDAEDGKVKAAIGQVRAKMLKERIPTFGALIATERDRRRTPLVSPDNRPAKARVGPREFRGKVRNSTGLYEHCADRALIRDEFNKLWNAQKSMGGALAGKLTDPLRLELDDPERRRLDGDPNATDKDRQTYKTVWREGGLLFGQRRQTWDLGTLGRCTLEPTERCAPHADRHASCYRVVETVNNLRIQSAGGGGGGRPLSVEERAKVIAFLRGPLGVQKATRGKDKGKERPKASVGVPELRALMGWGKRAKDSPFSFNIEKDEEREINTDWFHREVVHGAIGEAAWAAMPEPLREGINRALLRHDPDGGDESAAKLSGGLRSWAGLSETQAAAVVKAWQGRPRPDARRLTMSRRAVRNLLTVMDPATPLEDPKNPGHPRWPTQVEARKAIAEDASFRDVTTGLTFDEEARALVEARCKAQGRPFDADAEQAARRAALVRRRRYATGAKGATARDVYYMRKHVLMRDGEAIIGPDGRPLAEPPPAPLVTNPVVRKAIHEVRRHLVEYLKAFGRKPDEVRIELAREARMGKVDADRALLKNRLRERIRKEIAAEYNLDVLPASQRRAASDRVVLAVQQGQKCPLCGQAGLTPRVAAEGRECELAHIVPRASGGQNGYSNLVLAHAKCNREMGRRTPREYWAATLHGGFDEGMAWVKAIYSGARGAGGGAARGDGRKATGEALWARYFDGRENQRKVEQFGKGIADVQGFTDRQLAATKYAARQVMAYLADALYDGMGLPERSSGNAAGGGGDERRIFASDGQWTGRLRREWGLFFDPHGAREKGLSNDEEHARREKNRGDHRHHPVDAVVIALSDAAVQRAWEARELAAEEAGINTADEAQTDAYRRAHPVLPARFKDRDALRAAVERAVFGERERGEEGPERPVCHRPVKRKLVGAFHEETLLGPALDRAGEITNLFTAKKKALDLTPNHLRMPEGWEELEAVLSDDRATAERKAGALRGLAAMPDPPPGKSGIVRDRTLRRTIRACLRGAGIDPDDFSKDELKKALDTGGGFLRHPSGVPIRSAVLLRTMNDPVLVPRKRDDHATGTASPDPRRASVRAYVGGNNHHVEVRAARDKKGRQVFTGVAVTGFEAARRKRDKLAAFKAAGVPKPAAFRARERRTGRSTMTDAERGRWKPVVSAIERAHPIVDRRDNAELGGAFVLSIAEGETLFMRHKATKEPGYFVVAKIDKAVDPESKSARIGIVVFPHWDARAAGERKDAEGRPVPGSDRAQFSVTITDLLTLAPPGHPHAVKVRVSPLGAVRVLDRD
jgi:CRISPR-associated endonuclease Csn1